MSMVFHTDACNHTHLWHFIIPGIVHKNISKEIRKKNPLNSVVYLNMYMCIFLANFIEALKEQNQGYSHESKYP